MKGPGQILTVAAARRPHKTALITATRSLTYADLDAGSTRLACALLRCGVRPGPVVSLFGPRSWPVETSAADLIESTEGSPAAYKRRRLVRLVTDLPRTSSGRIVRRKLAEHADAAGAPPATGPGELSG